MTSKIKARIYRGTPRNIVMLARKLQSGEIVGVPTETVYGLAANALDAKACRRIFQAKERPTSDPLIVHLHNLAQLEQIAQPNETALKLAKAYWPGPLTLILPKKDCVPDIVTSNLDSVAVRIPKHPLFRKLLKTSALPLAAPSANPFGYVSPTTAKHVQSGLENRIYYILDGGPSAIGLESTIVDVRDPRKIRILRPGTITSDQISKTTGLTVRGAHTKSPSSGQLAPGMLLQHYSPRAKVVLHRELLSQHATTKSAHEAYLFFQKPTPTTPHCYWLDRKGSQSGAAHQLFSMLRLLDSKGYKIIHAEKAPRGEYSIAINDRLQRAAAKG